MARDTPLCTRKSALSSSVSVACVFSFGSRMIGLSFHRPFRFFPILRLTISPFSLLPLSAVWDLSASVFLFVCRIAQAQWTLQVFQFQHYKFVCKVKRIDNIINFCQSLVLWNFCSVLPQSIGTLMRTNKDPCKPFACEIQKCLKGKLWLDWRRLWDLHLLGRPIGLSCRS